MESPAHFSRMCHTSFGRLHSCLHILIRQLGEAWLPKAVTKEAGCFQFKYFSDENVWNASHTQAQVCKRAPEDNFNAHFSFLPS